MIISVRKYTFKGGRKHRRNRAKGGRRGRSNIANIGRKVRRKTEKGGKKSQEIWEGCEKQGQGGADSQKLAPPLPR